jgi:hypothetical protein
MMGPKPDSADRRHAGGLIDHGPRDLFAVQIEEKSLRSTKRLAAEKAAQYAASNAKLEQRVRVLEQIVTDSGAQTASQIEALRERPALESGEKSRMNPFEMVASSWSR